MTFFIQLKVLFFVSGGRDALGIYSGTVSQDFRIRVQPHDAERDRVRDKVREADRICDIHFCH